MTSIAPLIARFGAIVLLLATAAACGFIVGRTTAPNPPRNCDASFPEVASRVGGRVIVTQVC